MPNEEHSLATYVSDMLAVERHIQKPFSVQAKDDDFAKYANARALVTRLDKLAERHADALKSALDTLGGHEASAVKSAVTDVLGGVAGVIDKIRKTKVSKSLRDDYTALSLCTVSYTMLATTALSYGDARVASLAQQHLGDYTKAVMDISDAIPEVVVQELADLGLSVQQSAADEGRKIARNAWAPDAVSAL